MVEHYTESKDTSHRERENEDEKQAGGPDQEEPSQQAEQPSALAWKDFIIVVKNFIWFFLQYLSFFFNVLSIVVRPDKKTIVKEDNADETAPVITLDVNNEKENEFLKNTYKGNVQSGNARTLTSRGCDIAYPQDQLHMEHNQESEKRNPVHMTQGNITVVTDQSGDHDSIEGLKTVGCGESLMCQGGSQEVIDSSRTCCKNRALSGVDHIEDKATQTTKDCTWLTEVGVKQERDCMLNSYAEKQPDPTPKSELESISLKKQIQSTGHQKLSLGSRNDGITDLKGDESMGSPGEIAMIQDGVNVETESLTEESKVFKENAIDSITAASKIDIMTETSILPEVDSNDMSHSCNSEDDLYKKDNSSADRKGGKNPSVEEDEEDWEVVGNNQMIIEAKGDVNKKEKSRLSGGKTSSNCQDEKSDEGKREIMEKDQAAQSEGDLSKKGNSCPSVRKSNKSPSGKEDEDDWELVGNNQIITEAKGSVNKKEKSHLSDGERSSSFHDEKSDEGKCEMVEKDQLAKSEGDVCKKDYSCPSDRRGSKSHSGEKDEDDWELVGDNQMIAEAKGNVNKKEKSHLSDGKRSSSCHDKKSDEGKREMVEKDQPAKSEGNLCKQDNSCPSNRRGSKNHSGEAEEDEDDWELVGDNQLIAEAKGDVNKKEKSCLSDEKRSSTGHDENSDGCSWEVLEKHQVEELEKHQEEDSQDGFYKKDSLCPFDRKSSKNPSVEEDEEDWEVVGNNQMITEAKGDVNKKEKSLLSDGERSSSCHDEKSDEGKCEMVGKHQPAQSEGDLCKKDNSCPSDRKRNKNPSGKEDEEDRVALGQDQMLTEAEEDVNKKDKSHLSDGERSSSFHDETSDEGKCEMVEKDQLAKSEDEDDWEMIDKGQLTDIRDDVYKKGKSCLSGGNKSSSPLHGETDEDRCKLEKVQVEMMEKDKLEELAGSLYKEDNSGLSEKGGNYCPLDESDNFVEEIKSDGFPEYSEFGQNRMADETGYFSEVSQGHQGNDLKVPPPPLEDKIDHFCGKDGNVLMRRKCEKDPLEARTSGARPKERILHPPEVSQGTQGNDLKVPPPSLKDKGDQFCGKGGSVLMWRKFEKDPLEARTSGARPKERFPLPPEVSQDHQGNDLKVPPPPLKDKVDHFCGKDGNVLMRRKCEKDPLEASASGARPKERFPHPPDKIALQCSQYCAQNYWQQIIHQEGEIGRPCSEPCVSDYWLQMVIQANPHLFEPCQEIECKNAMSAASTKMGESQNEMGVDDTGELRQLHAPGEFAYICRDVSPECDVMKVKEDGGCSKISESTTEGGRLVTYCTEYP